MKNKHYTLSYNYQHRDIHLIDEDREYMDLFLDDSHKVEDVSIYFGQSSIKSEILVKVCNNKLPDVHDIFTIYVKEKLIKGTVKIPDEKLYQILELINNNEDLIIYYSDVQNNYDSLEFTERLIV